MKKASGPRANSAEATVNSKQKKIRAISKKQEEFGPAIRSCDQNELATLTSSGFVPFEPSDLGDRAERRRRRASGGEMEHEEGMRMEEEETKIPSVSSVTSGKSSHSASAQFEVSAEVDTSISAESASLEEKSEEEVME